MTSISTPDLSGVKIKTAAAFNGIYKYIAMPLIAEDGIHPARVPLPQG